VVSRCTEPCGVCTELSHGAVVLDTGTNSRLSLWLAERHRAESYCMVSLLTCHYYFQFLFSQLTFLQLLQVRLGQSPKLSFGELLHVCPFSHLTNSIKSLEREHNYMIEGISYALMIMIDG